MPHDILLEIFTIVASEYVPRNSKGWDTLANCTLVCRSWSRASSAVLFRYGPVLWETTSQQRRVWPPNLSKVKQIIRPASGTNRHASSTLTISRLSRALSVSVRLATLINYLEIKVEALDFVGLRSVVTQLANLRALQLLCSSITPTNKAKKQMYKYPGVPRHTLDVLYLSMRFSHPMHLGHHLPQLLDICSWFDACNLLHISIIGAAQDPNSDVLFKGVELPVKKISARHYHVCELAVQHCLGSAAEAVIDFPKMRTFSTHMSSSDFTAVNAFLSKHGHSLESCKLYMPFGIPVAGISDEALVLELTRPFASSHVPLATLACKNLHTLSLRWTVIYAHAFHLSEFRLLFNACLASLPVTSALRHLEIEVELLGFVSAHIDALLGSGINALGHNQSISSYVASLHWECLDRLILPDVEPVKIKLKIRTNDNQATYANLIRDKVARQTQEMLTFA